MTVDVTSLTPMSAIARKSAIVGISTVSDPAFTTRRRSSVEMSSASISAIASQSRAAKYACKRSSAWLAAFSSRGVWRLQFVEPRERGVDVCFVEYLAAVDQVAFDCQKVDPPPLGVESPLAKSHAPRG